jgi:hypothetical protein
MEMPKPQPEHQWLQQLVGDWEYEHAVACVPGQPEQVTRGTERVRSIGGLWVLCDGEGEMPGGGRAEMIITLGYDTDKKRFVGSFVASMMTMMWLYDGALDSSGKILTLDADGPDMTNPGRTTKYQDIIEIVEPDLRLLRSQAIGEDGQWRQFMRATYRRVRR